MSIKFLGIALLLLTGGTSLHAQMNVEDAFPNLTFVRPVDLQDPGDGTNRLFVVEQRGIIWVFDNHIGVTEKKMFLDIQDRASDGGGEEGLLGLAFHPDYPDSGYFYVNYTAADPLRTVVARYEVSSVNPDSAVYDSEFVLLEVNQPYSNHNGGQIAFGPDDLLYIAMGDGGSGGDPLGNGQNLQTLHGAILRIDVDTTTAEINYGIPSDNPFQGNTQGYREEIFAYGLRNPWRFGFDWVTGRLWLADVGQNDYEEIDIIEKGGNYGWNVMEGLHCYDPPAGCDTTGLTLPVWEYDHTVGRSITGGYVYRGIQHPYLVGTYVYADYVTGVIWALFYDEGGSPFNLELVDTALLITSFGIDGDNELYICAFDGHIYRLEQDPTGVGDRAGNEPSSIRVYQNYPNPFNPTTVISFTLPGQMRVNLSVYDVRGTSVRTLIDGTLEDGRQEVSWDGTDTQGNPVSSGVYFYRLQADNHTLTRKMVLLR